MRHLPFAFATLLLLGGCAGAEGSNSDDGGATHLPDSGAPTYDSATSGDDTGPIFDADDDTTPPSDDTTPADDALVDTGVDVDVPLGCPPASPSGGACSALTAGPGVAQMNVAEALPTPIGGSFPDGVYTLIGSQIYTGPGGASGPTGSTLSGKDVFCSGAYEYSFYVNGTRYDARGFYSTSGTSFDATQTCPTSSGGPSGYSVVPVGPSFQLWFFVSSEIRIYRPGG